MFSTIEHVEKHYRNRTIMTLIVFVVISVIIIISPALQQQAQTSNAPDPSLTQTEPAYAKPVKSRSVSSQSPTSPQQPTNPMQVTGGHDANLDTMLGDLQSDMNRQGVNTKKKGVCAACNKAIVGQVRACVGMGVCVCVCVCLSVCLI